MPHINWTLFLPATLIMLLTPGPAVLYIVTRGIDQGRRAGLVSVLGIGLGTLVHVVFAAFGLSALLMASALAFSIVKYLGAAYLIYLGIRTLLARDKTDDDVSVSAGQSLWQVLRQGVLVSIFNPHTALFFFAFLPQFVDPAYGSVSLQMLILGVLFVLMAMSTDSVYALLAGSLGGWLRGSRRVRRGQRYVAGTVYIGLGLSTALSGSNQK